ncbi:MAG: GlsB/YeaQ/YmgE family stress response membrane protein [Thermodesulfobacteriota bacterium]
MSIIAWIILGLAAGFIASKIVNRTGEGFIPDIPLVIIGTVTGGWLFGLFGMHGVKGLNTYSLIVAISGAVVFLALNHTVRRRVYLIVESKKS